MKNNFKKPIFTIDTPPPTVSGSLHIGHIFSYTHTDIIARYKRLQGFEVFYPIGFDDNGLPTERLVESRYKVKAKEIQKEDFLDKCNTVIEEVESEFKNVFDAISHSYEWQHCYKTISSNSAKVAQMSFLDLYHKGLIYNAKAPVYWDVVDKTALSQADLEDKETDSVECFLKFYTINNTELEIMTTRPEMLSGCVAIFFNPSDTRYSDLEGLEAVVPFFDFKVPILPDEDVKMEKGTGLVMCCKYGDWQDVEWIRKHAKQISHKECILSEFGYIKNPIDNTNYHPEIIETWGKDAEFTVKQYREKIIKTLEFLELINKKILIKHSVKIAERSKANIEIIDKNQWFLNIKDFKNDLLLIAEAINFHPSHLKNRLIQWIEGVNQDWCISRDRYLGIKVPAFVTDDEVFIAEKNQLPVEKDDVFDYPEIRLPVFDTWFTSSVSPQLNSGKINSEYYLDEWKNISPMSLRPQSHEIIRTWTFYTIVKSYLHGLTRDELESRNQYVQKFGNTYENIKHFFEQNIWNRDVVINRFIPWTDVMLSGWCLASDKTKMSKSKGNGVDPYKLIQEHSSDIVRYWASCSNLGVDTPFNETKFKDGKRLISKVKNAVNFCNLSTDNMNFNQNPDVIYDFDKWILTKISYLIENVEKEMNRFEYSKAKTLIEDFFWKDFCDDYLEIVKTRSYGLKANLYDGLALSESEKNHILSAQDSCIFAIKTVLNSVSIMLYPFIPNSMAEVLQDLKIENNEDLRWPNQKFKFEYNISNALPILHFTRAKKSEEKLSIKSPVFKIGGLKPDMPNNVKHDLFQTINALKAQILNTEEVTVEV
jgi:valyl-tRNA synthetase